MAPKLYDDITGRDDQCIRLVRLDGADADSGMILCRLETVVLQDAPEYWALSYCWGDPSEPLAIVCNGAELPVTRNLHAALLRLLKVEPRPPLWIDALCINQQDPHEKAEQVKRMGQIYRRTQKVVIWLGPADEGGGGDEDVEVAMDLCRKYHNVEVAGTGIRQRMMLNSTVQPLPVDGQKGKFDWNRLAEYERERDAIANLLGRSWWQRVWVIQELALARDVHVVCGDAMIEWHVFSRGICNFIDLCDPYGLDFSPIHYHHARTMLDFRAKPSGDDSEPLGKAEARHRLVTLLHHFRWSYATDPRDKVYGLLGLASAGQGEPNINVRYTSDASGLHDVVECYISATYEIIKTNRSLDVLQLCGVPPALIVAQSSLEGLPSWTPNFSLDTSKLANKFIDPGMLESPTLKARLSLAEEPTRQPQPPQAPAFSAAGDSQADKVDLLDAQAIMLAGFLWDTIEVVGIPSPDTAATMRAASADNAKLDDAPESQRREMLRARLALIWSNMVVGGSQIYDLLAWWELASGLPKTYPNGQPLLDAFYGVVHQGHFENGIQIPAARYAANFKRVLRALRGVDRCLLGPLLPARWRDARLAAMLVLTFPLLLAWPSMDLRGAAHSRLVRTRRGYLALVPQQVRAGDGIALLRGGTVPFVVRPRTDGAGGDDAAPRWELVGSCYVHGVMHGEQWDESLCHPMVFV